MSVNEVDTPQASSQVRGDIIKHTRGYLPKLTSAHKQGHLNTRLIFITQQAIRYSLLLRLHPTYMFLESPSTLSVQFLDKQTDPFTKTPHTWKPFGGPIPIKGYVAVPVRPALIREVDRQPVRLMDAEILQVPVNVYPPPSQDS